MLPSTAVGLHKDTIALQVDDLPFRIDLLDENRSLLHHCRTRFCAFMCVNVR
jgi:hypothetical protein